MGSNRERESRSKAGTVADLLQRVASSCLSQRLPGTRTFDDDDDDEWSSSLSLDKEEAEEEEAEKRKKKANPKGQREDSIARAIAKEEEQEEEEEEEEEEQRLRIWEEDKKDQPQKSPNADKHKDPPTSTISKDKDKGREVEVEMMDALLAQVFDSVSALKRSYRALQQAHCPWDPHQMQAADAALVSHLRKLDTLRDRFRRARRRPHTTSADASLPPSASLSDTVAPYEAALNDLQKELKVKDAELENLRHKLSHSDLLAAAAASRKGRSHSARWASSFSKGVVGKMLAFFNHLLLTHENVNLYFFSINHCWTKSTNQAARSHQQNKKVT